MSDMNNLSELRARLSPAQRVQLQQRLRGGVAAADASHAIPRRPDGGSAELSFAQQRQWFLWRLDPASAAYHLSGGLKFSGHLDVAALRASIGALVARHPSLRTVFRQDEDGGVRQVVQPAAAIELPSLDFSAFEPAARASFARAEIRRLCAQPFDLGHGPLLRVALFKMVHDQQQLLLVMHHIVSDGYSTQLILDELAQQYAARVQGAQAQLADLPIDYSDYAVWQRTWLAGEAGAQQLAWWRALLGQQQPVLALQTARPRKADGVYGAARHSVALPAELVAGLKRQAQAQGGTLFMALLTGFQALLFRYSGQGDIRVGVPIANRNRAETTGLIGFFVNTQVLPARLDARMALAQLFEQTRDNALGAQAHQDLPFEQLVEALQPERSLSGNPLFQVMYNHLRLDHRSLAQWPGVSVERVDFDEQDVQCELTLNTSEGADGRVRASFSYAAELFDAAHIETMAAHYLLLLQALAEQPEQALGDVGLLAGPQLRQLAGWGANPQRHPDMQPVHRLFERQVLAAPRAVALLCGDEQLSYDDLNIRANRLAHRLIAAGVGPESRVGIALERSIDMVAALLAVLKAGGAYVPLDPDYPSERLRYMVEDSGIGTLLTHSALAGQIAGVDPARVLELDTLDLSGESAANPAPALHGENLAYVIYTSGSTGKPKGAANRHGALHNRLAWMQQAYQLTPADTVLQKTPFSFDVSVWEFFWPLMVGARLAIAAPGEHREPARLMALIRRHQVTTLHFVPSMLQAFLAHEGVDACTTVKRIVCSGEALPAEAQKAVFAGLPRAQLFNLYGPTEAAIDVTHWTCRNDGASQVPIGRPISATHTYVLDGELNFAPAGVAGELYLGGVGLGRGYLDRAALTSERFVADPFDPLGGRLYRTGDLARWNAEGQLEYLGRIDHQVKIRGFRIELGEIEAQLLAQPEVREAVVVANEGARLVAYLAIAAPDGQFDPASLRERLGRALPDYMVPHAFMVLERLPLNANGKIDRKALPAPERQEAAAYAAPRGEAETALAQVWAEVLGLPRIGRHDNFFELGGHSLLAVQMAARVQRATQRELTVQQVFQHPTLGAMALLLADAGGKSAEQALSDLDSFIDSLENV
ncbi:non-ribosomal peptide synthetase [Janthinobacterium sp. CG_S6]|uniref:non-ribosomal peptide synthetase n=1 Tax=unclassified Janthinobacterium TaxID=2610881 RepID=UPI000347A1E6|nr:MULTISPECIES: non-ribosomal peptide synthetase [unclassified Janthinobacterium]MEC5161350.1 amino acid adenylation domain-containing protein [Janthinobacterium sp. CG_S6]